MIKNGYKDSAKSRSWKELETVLSYLKRRVSLDQIIRVTSAELAEK